MWLAAGGDELQVELDVQHRYPRPLAPGQAQAVLRTAVDQGINFFDTSIDYGASEALFGEVLSAQPDELVVATKCGCPIDADRWIDAPPGPLPHDYSRANIRAGLHQSLRRLGRDYVDLLLLHGNPSVEELERTEAVSTMLELRDEGKVRFVGASLSALPNLVGHLGLGVFDVFQLPYSALETDHEEIMTAAAASGIGIIVRGGVARGNAAGGFGADEKWARWEAAELDDFLGPWNRVQLLLMATIANPAVSTAIVGTANTTHVVDNASAVGSESPPKEILAEIRRRLGNAPRG